MGRVGVGIGIGRRRGGDAINALALYDFNFASGQIKGAQWSDAVVTRASTAYALNASGAYEEFASNVLRRTNLGVTIEEARTNIFSNSAAPATQTITVVNGTTYTVSCFVSGSVVLSGAGTGTATPGSNVTFTASSTSLTCTVSGSPFCVNVEAASFGTTPIVGSGATTTRPADVVYWPVSGLPVEYSIFVGVRSVAGLGSATFNALASLTATNNNDNRYQITLNSGLTIGTAVTSGGASQASPSTANTTSYGASFKAAQTLLATTRVSLNGGAIASQSVATKPVGISRLYVGARGSGDAQANGVIERISVLPALTDAQLQAFTL